MKITLQNLIRNLQTAIPFARRVVLALGKVSRIASGIAAGGVVCAVGQGGADQPAQRPDAEVPIYRVDVVGRYPHDATAFTQGLVFDGGWLYEGTGRYGESTLRKVELATGKVVIRHELAKQYFGEGITRMNRILFQLTWKSRKGFVYKESAAIVDGSTATDRGESVGVEPQAEGKSPSPGAFELLREFTIAHEGWGITHDGHRLIVSDGTNVLRFYDPRSLEAVRELAVRYRGRPLRYLNELEMIGEHIMANVWTTEMLAAIHPETGNVDYLVDLRGLMPPVQRGERRDVLNGIAYDSEGDRWFVTGKWWPWVFEVKVLRGRD